MDIASGMTYLHSVGVLHGDLKSANVLLKSTATDLRGFCCKIADFGCGERRPHHEDGDVSRKAPFVASRRAIVGRHVRHDLVSRRTCSVGSAQAEPAAGGRGEPPEHGHVRDGELHGAGAAGAGQVRQARRRLLLRPPQCVALPPCHFKRPSLPVTGDAPSVPRAHRAPAGAFCCFLLLPIEACDVRAPVAVASDFSLATDWLIKLHFTQCGSC